MRQKPSIESHFGPKLWYLEEPVELGSGFLLWLK